MKPLLKKLKFLAGLDPKIIKKDVSTRYIPHDKQTVVLISADFELAWAPRYDKSVTNSLQLAIEKAKQERKNIPEILALCDQYNIPITWATIGHLFLERCEKENNRAHPTIPKVSQYIGPFWDFKGTDWFEYDPCADYKQAPEWYAPDLIWKILESPVQHEVGCHTFSHIDCRDGICTPELMRSELQKCKELAKSFGLELKSFVHPGHTIGNLEVLANEGFTNFRTDYRNVLGYPKKHQNGLLEIEQTTEFFYYNKWSDNFQIKRYIEIIKRAMNSNSICVFWFHPSFQPIMIEKILPEVFRFLNNNMDKIWITTHNEYNNWLNQNES